MGKIYIFLFSSIVFFFSILPGINIRCRIGIVISG